MPKLIIITGPTASGKSELAIRLAKMLGGIILSCDSVQFYQGMDIGSAKVPPVERLSIPHYGLDLVPAWKTYNVKRFEIYAKNLIETSQEPNIFIVGGSGFYLDIFINGPVDDVSISDETRRLVQNIQKEKGRTGLLEKLKSRNPYLVFDENNERRIVRYLERCIETNLSIPEQIEQWKRKEKPFANYEKKVLLLAPPRDILRKRIGKRVEQMIENGLIEEVENLRRHGFEQNPSAANAIGYRETLDFLDGKIENLKEAIRGNSCRLLRKQDTWFRKKVINAIEIRDTSLSDNAICNLLNGKS